MAGLFRASPARAPAPEARSIRFGTRELPYILKRSARRTLGLRVDARGLTVSVPLHATLADTEAFLRQHGAWIVEKLDARAAHTAVPPFEPADGAQLPVLGQPCVLRLVHGAGRVRWIEGHAERELHLPQRPGADLRLVLRRVLQRRALEYFGGRLDEYVHRLTLTHPHIARPPLALTGARTRWGSCSRHSGIRLNWRLIHLEYTLIDYVVAHEVAHLVEMNHSPRFWSLVDLLCPDWRAARQALRHAGEAMPLV